jgi:hypothetical protein
MSTTTPEEPTSALTTRVERIVVTIGDARFGGRIEHEATPLAASLIERLLPLERRVLHARWSGEAIWVALGDIGHARAERATSYPRPGQVLLYAGARSEPELLIAYGACAFACMAGALAGSPVITLDASDAELRPIGERVLWHGALPFRIERA